MAIENHPVTFHVRAEARAELIEARRRRARPYRAVAQAVAAFALTGVGLGYFAGQFAAIPGAAVATAPGAANTPVAATATASPAFPVWRPQPREAPVREIALAPSDIGVDTTPVGSIPDSKSPHAVFAPAVRAPDYSGFRVIAGH